MAFAVSRLWERRDQESKLLTREAYRKIGGVEGALAQHAEATLERIGPDNEGIVRSIFRDLTTAQGTRAVLTREELLSALPNRYAAELVLRQLVDARLLTSYETEGTPGEPGESRVEILHESLLSAWPRLVRWQTQSADGAQLRDQLRQAAHLWQERGKSDDLLWTGASDLEYLAWRDRYEGGLSSVEEDFAKAMSGFASRKRTRRRAAIAATVAALILGRGVYLNARDREAAHADFLQQGQRLHAEVAVRINQVLENLSTLSSVLEVFGRQTRPQFRRLTLPFLRQDFGIRPGSKYFLPDLGYVYAFEWLPLVDESERQFYESEAHSAGLSDYKFWETGPDGKPQPVAPRKQYVPIHYIEPPKGPAFGYDIASDRSSWLTAQKARDQGIAVASLPFRLVERDNGYDYSSVVAVYFPIYIEDWVARAGSLAQRQAELSGFLVAIVHCRTSSLQRLSVSEGLGARVLAAGRTTSDSGRAAGRGCDTNRRVAAKV